MRLIALLITAFLLQAIATTFFYPIAGSPLSGNADFFRHHALHFNALFHPAQLLTHFLVQPPGLSGLLGLLLYQCLTLWFFGSELERSWGSHYFLKFFLFGLLGGLALGSLVAFLPEGNFPYYGIYAGIAAMLTAYAMLWPERQVYIYFIIPVKMKWLVPVILILGLFGGWQMLLQNCGGALAGALFVYYYARRGRSSDTTDSHNYSDRASSTGYATGGRTKGIRARFEEYRKKKRLEKKQAEINQRIEMKEEVDRLLEKISREGMDSLSRKEKSFLDKASREF